MRMAEREGIPAPKDVSRLTWLTCPNSIIDTYRVLRSLANPNRGGGV